MDRGAWRATVRGVATSGTRLKPLHTLRVQAKDIPKWNSTPPVRRSPPQLAV